MCVRSNGKADQDSGSLFKGFRYVTWNTIFSIGVSHRKSLL